MSNQASDAFGNLIETLAIVDAVTWMFCAANRLERMSAAEFWALHIRLAGYPPLPDTQERMITTYRTAANQACNGEPGQALRLANSGETAWN